MKKILTTSLSLLCLQSLPLTLQAETTESLSDEEKQVLVSEAKTQMMQPLSKVLRLMVMRLRLSFVIYKPLLSLKLHLQKADRQTGRLVVPH